MKHLTNYFTKLLLLVVIAATIALTSCGGGEKNNEKTDTTKATDTTSSASDNAGSSEGKSSDISEASSDAETTMCFEFKDLTIVTTNLKIKGDQVTGTHYVRTPKAGMELYSNFALKGTKNGNNIDVDMTMIASNNMFGVGETSKMSWVIKGDQLINPKRPDDMGGTQKKIVCAEGTVFKLEPKEAEANDPYSGKYNLSGTINGNLKIKMYIETSKGEAGNTNYNGWYYYESQGPDKKIELRGAVPGAGIMAGEVEEFTNGKHTGSFMIEAATDLNEGLDCEWTDVAKKKALKVSLKLDSKL